MTILLSYLFYFIAASASPLQRRWLATKREADYKGQIDFAFKVVLVTVLLSLALPFFSRFALHGNIYYLVFLAAVCGIFGAVFFITSFIAQKHVEAGITTIVANIYTPVTIMLATVFLLEGLTPKQLLGMALLLIAMVMVSKKHRIGRFRFDMYVLLMVAGGIALGIVLTAEKALINTTGFTAGTMISWWSQCAFLGIATLVSKSKTTYARQDIAVTGVLRFLQSLSWVILLVVVGNLSVVSAVTTFKVVVIFIVAAILLNEREDMTRKMFGSIVAVVGLFLMK